MCLYKTIDSNAEMWESYCGTFVVIFWEQAPSHLKIIVPILKRNTCSTYKSIGIKLWKCNTMGMLESMWGGVSFFPLNPLGTIFDRNKTEQLDNPPFYQ